MKALEAMVKVIGNEFGLKNVGRIMKNSLRESIRDHIPTIGQRNFELRDIDEYTTEISIPLDDVTLIGHIHWRKGEWHPFVVDSSELVEVREN